MALPVEVLFGVYLGLLTGILPALVAWSLGFLFRYSTGVTVPGLAVVMLGVGIAGVNGGLLGLLDQTIRSSPRLITATIVVLMMTLYAHNRGDQMGATFPHHLSLRSLWSLRERTLSADVVELVGGRGQVRVEVAGEVRDLEGYPPLPADLRAAIREGSWTFPADVPLSELEARLASRLRTEHDLADAAVTIDERARATVAAAPPSGALSKRVPEGRRAVSVDALLPTGLARGDEVTVQAPDVAVEGVVASARTYGGEGPAPAGRQDGQPPTGDGATADGSEPPAPVEALPPPAAPTTDGGEGRLTVAVAPADAERLLSVDRARVVVRSRGVRREFELVSLLRQAGKRFRKLAVREGGPLDGTALGEAALRDAYGVAVLGVRRAPGDGDDEGDRRWVLAPGDDAGLSAGDELFAVGTPAALDRLREVAA